jgi:catechol 2,3-dioxygenase
MHWPTARITHIGLNVTDLRRSVDFYSNALGMKVMKSADGRFATVSFGYQHHDIALIPARGANGGPTPVGMNHFAIEVRDYCELVRFTGRLIDAGVAIERAIDHRTGVGVYFKDPDGNSVELWCENFPTMERAIAFGEEMTEEFEENHIGYPLDVQQLYRDYKAGVGSTSSGPIRPAAESLC